MKKGCELRGIHKVTGEFKEAKSAGDEEN